MIRSPLTHRALAIAHMAHAHQTHETGVPYVEHVLYVANQMPDEMATAVALLHDVLAHTKFTTNDLLRYGIDREVVDQVEILTPKEGQSTMDYILALKNNPVARQVKLADLRYNSNLARYEAIPLEAYVKQEAYQKAIQTLEAA